MNNQEEKGKSEAQFLTNLAKIETPKRGRPKGKVTRKYQKDLVLSDSDNRVLKFLATGMNKSKVAELEGVTRRDLYRLLDSGRVAKIKANAENRLQALLELAVMVIHKDLLEGNTSTALTILRNFGLLQTEGKSNVNAKGAVKKTTLEQIMENDGKETRRIIKEDANDESTE